MRRLSRVPDAPVLLHPFLTVLRLGPQARAELASQTKDPELLLALSALSRDYLVHAYVNLRTEEMLEASEKKPREPKVRVSFAETVNIIVNSLKAALSSSPNTKSNTLS